MTKEEVIQKAYGEYWDELPLEAQKEVLENNGWVNKYYLSIEFRNQNYNECKQIDIVTGQSWAYRPKSLQGIENNNGWIKVESEEGLPKEKDFFNACYFNGKNEPAMFYGISHCELIGLFEEKVITHYKPIEKPKPPIYI